MDLYSFKNYKSIKTGFYHSHVSCPTHTHIYISYHTSLSSVVFGLFNAASSLIHSNIHHILYSFFFFFFLNRQPAFGQISGYPVFLFPLGIHIVCTKQHSATHCVCLKCYFVAFAKGLSESSHTQYC